MPGLIRFRWIAIVSLILGVLPLFWWGYIRREFIPYILTIVVLLAIFNILSQGIWPKQDDSDQRHVLVHLWVDLLAAVGLLFAVGGASNPFVGVLCIHSFLGGMLLRRKASYLFGFTVLVFLSFLQIQTYGDYSHTVNADMKELFLQFLSQWVLIVGSWFVSHFFSGLLAKKEKHIRHLQDRHHQADRLKSLGALTAGFSHQLATPMNSLKLRMDRGLRKLEGSDLSAKEEFKKAELSLNECIRVFKHMASVFSRSAASELQKVEMRSLVTDLIKVWEKENDSLVVEKHIAETAMFCKLQVLSFAQALFDLLDNAMEASAEGATAYVRFFREDSWAILEIVDKGEGLSPEILSRLGEPFATSKEYGNGLGLYSVSMMAQASGGEFTITNNKAGVGATARIRLPLEEK